MPRSTDVLIIGAGQAGLAASRHLTARGIDHVVLERGAIAQRWTAERWPSLHLLSPNWMTRLPHWQYRGPDQHGFMHKDAFARYLQDYAADFGAPVETQTAVHSLRSKAGLFHADTSGGPWQARNVIIATGACDQPFVPGFARDIAPEIQQITPRDYQTAADLAPGNVLVVGASATGAQLAEEIQRSGRQVTLAVGRHSKLPRRYRGQDILHWFSACGLLTETRAQDADPASVFRQPSLQIVGGPEPRNLDLASLSATGIRILGRATSAEQQKIRLSWDLPEQIAAAEHRHNRVLARIDHHIAQTGLDAPHCDWPQCAPLPLPDAVTELDLAAEGIKTILWATGYRRDYPWLHLPALTPQGEIQQTGGVTPVPGLYTLGLPFMRRRNSAHIDGVGQDAHDITDLIAADLGLGPALAA